MQIRQQQQGVLINLFNVNCKLGHYCFMSLLHYLENLMLSLKGISLISQEHLTRITIIMIFIIAISLYISRFGQSW